MHLSMPKVRALKQGYSPDSKDACSHIAIDMLQKDYRFHYRYKSQIYNWVPLKTGENITKKIVNRTISKCQPCRPSRRDTTEVLETCRSLVSLSQELMVAFHALSPW